MILLQPTADSRIAEECYEEDDAVVSDKGAAPPLASFSPAEQKPVFILLGHEPKTAVKI